MNIQETLRNVGIIPVIRLTDPADAVPLAKALCSGGLPAAEITFRSDAAEESIRRAAQEVPEVFVCAGTVLDVPTAKRAVQAGAKAIVSPGLNPAVVEWCLENGVPVVPGVATPSEAEAAMRLGLDFVKLFPAQVVGGVKMLKALAGPYSDLKFMPTGGISPENVGEYLAQKNVVCCGGSWLAPEALISKGKFGEIEALAREAAALAKKR